MPVYTKTQVASILDSMDQKQNTPKLTKDKLDKTLERTTASHSVEILRSTSMSAKSSPVHHGRHAADVSRSPAPLGISGYNFKGNAIDQIMAKNEQRAEDQNQPNDSERLPGTPEAARPLVRSSSMPEPAALGIEALPVLNRSSSSEEPGAAIKAALGSRVFASFQRTSLASVLLKVKTTVDEQINTVHDVNDGDANTSSHKIPQWEEKTQSVEFLVDAKDSVEDRATFEIERQSNLRQLRLKSMCYESESAETREALDRISATDKKNSTSRRIQKLWKFNHIAEVQVRPYSGLRKNADAARRPSSAINLNSNLENDPLLTTPRSNPSVITRSVSRSGNATDSEKTRVPGVVAKMRERSSMGPGGFWRAGLRSASTEAIERKMPECVASIPEIRKAALFCNVCLSLGGKDALGRCKYCRA